MAISPLKFYRTLKKNNINFFSGVPDSLLKQFNLCLEDNLPSERNIIAANEGNAISLAAGYHLGTGELPVVYMQNSGLGNAVNPLLSLCDPDVYSIPILLIVGWRGEPGFHDEPQHIKQGKIQLDLLQAMDIPYRIISMEESLVDEEINICIRKSIHQNRPVALIIRKGTFDKYESPLLPVRNNLMTREEVLEIILDKLSIDTVIVSTTGKTSREIFEIREKRSETHHMDFLTVGSMGHCSSIALGIAIAQPKRNVICIDGDGALIMHMGSLSTIGKIMPRNFYHILINNNVHESVGGQETSAKNIDMPIMARSNGYKHAYIAHDFPQLKTLLCTLLATEGPSFLEIKVRQGSRLNLGRPTIKPIDNKTIFMNYLKG